MKKDFISNALLVLMVAALTALSLLAGLKMIDYFGNMVQAAFGG